MYYANSSPGIVKNAKLPLTQLLQVEVQFSGEPMIQRCNLKVYDTITFGFIHRNGVFGIRRKPLFFSSPL